MNTLQWTFITELIRKRTGIIVSQTKYPLIEYRIQRLLAQLNYTKVSQLIQQLHPIINTTILQALTECFAIHESLFFRHPSSFVILRKHVIPDLLTHLNTQKKLRIWSAGCAYGQEVYSLAIILSEYFPRLKGWEVSILGTDISPTCIERSQSGSFSEFEIQRGLSEQYIQKYTTKTTNQTWRFQIPDHINIEFSVMNLVQPFWHHAPFDLILARNVLIYFDVETQKRTLYRFDRYMSPHSQLVLGPSEKGYGIFQDHKIEDLICYRQRSFK